MHTLIFILMAAALILGILGFIFTVKQFHSGCNCEECCKYNKPTMVCLLVGLTIFAVALFLDILL